MGSVEIKNLTKKFGETLALKNVNINIEEGEFFALLGPSGCGKTTTMRCIAGFEDPTDGEIILGDQVVNDIPANMRNCGMVFQSYALFPHLNVFDNVAYSLNIKDLKEGGFLNKGKVYGRMLSNKLFSYPNHIKDKVNEILEYVELDHLSQRMIGELSGGQQQRVALARSLVMEPSILLMDEPLSNLDQKLRHTMRNTIRRIQQDLGITTIFVTHDQEEAMSMADRIAVMDQGEVMQVGTPTDLYSNPSTPFIADFVGTSNLLKGKAESINNEMFVNVDGNQLKSTYSNSTGEVDVVIRPEHLTIINDEKDAGSFDNVIEGEVLFSTYLGSIVRYDVKAGNENYLVDTTYNSGDSIYQPGTTLKLTVEPERVLIL
ncbi:ABC transporter ATP-binding protein [Tenuibacillus multivorans]|uniref:Iron(III) transport system ATP-binding protein/putative spermidine/putrescine transport system ATP-binding protein/spermidine/putrescine transport system ATP-binding protein n=1 Tax=Tenuibacillus multivorans TaxID=237069 RepID=A0A1H0BWX3_9BACI|nr:ABC transporter ATP-binding protein [Tenuibacillus multivorans]GEL78552.1 iron ABC transporter ATP-binding protein [Tenuibacillus multivorans]SDN50093.1 iron(III) transport system ATP-binding protein/putative spermidine/putrescine transport system ATP-binding protein/spermidine/putrescine transport system ATP-binding protein [Tenuibacillus multivorans]